MYSPEQRRSIEVARRTTTAAVNDLPNATSQNASTTSGISPRLRLDGVVARGSGKGTAWVNMEAVPQGSNLQMVMDGLEAVVEGHRLRVGESYDRDTGTRSDFVALGSVRKRLVP